MRVVLLITDLHPGGAPLRTARLARGLRDAGVEVHVGCLAPIGRVGEQLAADGISVFSVNARGPSDFAALWRLRKEIRRIAPDLLHSTLFHANLAARVVGKFAGVPVLTSTATIEVERPWHVLLEKLTVGWDRGHTVNSEALATHIHDRFGVPREQIFHLPIAIEPGKPVSRETALRDLGLAPGPFRVAWAGRMDPVKCVERLIAALRRPALNDVELLLIGDGPKRDEWQRLAINLGVADRTRWLGWRDDPRAAIAAADLFALPSRTEGLPNAILDAFAAGVPVIASDIPSIRELAGDPPRIHTVRESQVVTWAAAVDQLRSAPSTRAALSARAREWVEREGAPERWIAATIDVYRRVTA